MPAIPPNNRNLGRFVAMSQVGMEMVVPLLIGLVIDSYWGTKPWGVVLGMIFGFVGGIAHLVVLANQKENGKQPPEGDPR